MSKLEPKYKVGTVVKLVTLVAARPELPIGTRGIIVDASRFMNAETRYRIKWIDKPNWPFAKGRLFYDKDLELDDSLAGVIYG